MLQLCVLSVLAPVSLCTAFTVTGLTLIAERSLDPDYPGIDMEFVPNGNTETPCTYPRVVIEKPKGEKLRCLVWGIKDSEDYTDKIEFDLI